MLLLGPLPATVLAQDEFEAKARVTRKELDSGRSETVIDRELIERSSPENVGQQLALSDGLVVQRTSSASAAPIIRGMTGYQVLLMLGDLRLNDSLTRAGGNALLNLIDPESVERLEIVRGPSSVTSGSDALGGVVRVVTRSAGAKPDADGNAGADIYARGATAERAMRAQASVNGGIGPVAARVSGGRGHAGELERGGDLGDQPFTGHDDWSFASRLEATPSEPHLISIEHQSGHIFDMPRSDVSTPEDRQTTLELDRDAGVLAYTGNLREHGLRLHAYAGMVLRREVRERLREDRSDIERDRVLSYQAGASATFGLWEGSQLEFGGDANLERIGSGVEQTQDGMTTRDRGRYLDGSEYDSYGVYAFLSQALPADFTLLGGVRGAAVHIEAPADPLMIPEAMSEFGPMDETLFGAVGSIGVRHDFMPHWSWSLSGISGFRAPNLEDLQAFGGGARGFTIPNPELEEEYSYTLEAGLALDAKHFRGSAYVFGTWLDDLIVRVPTTLNGEPELDGEPVLRRQNASHGVLVGGELTATYRFDLGLYTGLGAWMTWGETERPDDTGRTLTEPATKVPPPMGRALLGYEASVVPIWGEAVVNVALTQDRLSAGDLDDVRICPDGAEGCNRVAGYTELTLRAGLHIDPYLQLVIALENVFDTGYKTYASGTFSPGRSGVLSMRGKI